MKKMLLLSALLLAGVAISGTGRYRTGCGKQFEKKNLHIIKGRLPHMPRPAFIVPK
ncbi:hypothetical protein [uncultured Chitinophaga sp.]|uniref:hypothetical protein n=1 Tax=uncultured Chitinophaga sp. TaxID=339340 RepID=UPI0025DF4E2C|nr:hypothetical protein [uncultured Chitinophaga sp.]